MYQNYCRFKYREMRKLLIVIIPIFYQVSANYFHVDDYNVKNTSLLKITGEVTDIGEKQYYEGELHNPISLGDNVLVTFDIYYHRNDWIHLVKLKNIPGCRFFRQYLGPMLTDIEKNAGLQPGKCPINRGNYHVNKTLISIKNLGYTLFPRGNLKIDYLMILKDTSRVIFQSSIRISYR